MNRSLSIRSNKSSGQRDGKRHPFSFNSLRGQVQPELSRKLYRLIKSENHLIQAHEAAGKERVSIASQISEWGEATTDDAISELSDKIGVLLAEIGEQEDLYAHNLDDSRGVLKHVRNMEKSVQPTRDHKAKLTDEIAKLKSKEPESTKIQVLEQELVRAEAESLVAEAQLTNITRQKFKQAYEMEFAATIERAEKQIILARHGRRLLQLLDDTPGVPGHIRPAFDQIEQARQILNDAEEDLREWRPTFDEAPSNAPGGGQDAMVDYAPGSVDGSSVVGGEGSIARGGGSAAGYGNAVNTEGVEAHRIPAGTSAADAGLGAQQAPDTNFGLNNVNGANSVTSSVV